MTTYHVNPDEGRFDAVDFTAQRRAVLCGVRFREGDMVRVALRRTWDADDGLGEGGPWGWGGYTSRTLRRIASRIEDLSGRRVDPIYEREG